MDHPMLVDQALIRESMDRPMHASASFFSARRHERRVWALSALVTGLLVVPASASGGRLGTRSAVTIIWIFILVIALITGAFNTS